MLLKAFALVTLLVSAGTSWSAGAGAGPKSAGEIVIYQRPDCACCQRWAESVRLSGFVVRIEYRDDMSAVRASSPVPPVLRSCHTSQIGEYIVEGHVPVRAIRQLLDQRPDLAGIAVRGMPAGAPGMEGPGARVYAIYGFTVEGDAPLLSLEQGWPQPREED